MKTNALHYAWAAGSLLVFTFTGCNNENEFTADNGKEAEKLMTITATQNNATTRLAHTPNAENGGLTVTWEAGDAFMMYRDGVSAKFSTTGGGTQTASFTGADLEGSGNYNAFYPHSRAQKNWSDNYISVQGQVQKGATSTAHLNEYDFMTATDWDGTGNLTFLRQVAVLKFIVTLPTGKFPRLLTLSRQDNSDLAVGLKIGKSGANPATAKQLTLKIVKDAAGADADFSAFTAYMCVLPSTLTGGPLAASITCTDDAGTLYNYKVESVNAGTAYDAGHIYHATLTETQLTGTPVVEFGNNVDPVPFASATGAANDPYLISSAGNLQYFINQISNKTDLYQGKHVKLATDIHIMAAAWTPIGNRIGSFKGTFDGGGHTISGKMSISNTPSYIAYLGFFANLAGSVNDLHVSATLEYTGTSSNVYIGAIASDATGAFALPTTISHCTFSGKISFTNDWSDIKETRIGGIIGSASTYCIFSHCTSMTDINVNKTGGIVCLGGIIGRGSGGTIYHCLNTGNMTISSTRSGDCNAGGIIGYSEASPSGPTMSNIQYCRNKGSINIGGGTNQYAGGVAGYIGGISASPGVTNIHTSHNENASISVASGSYFGSLCGVLKNNNGNQNNIYNCCTGPSSIPMIGGGGSLKDDDPTKHID